MGWLLIAGISLFISLEDPGPYFTLIGLQQMIFLGCGVMGAEWDRFLRPSGKSIIQGLLLGIGLYLVNIISGTLVVQMLDWLGADHAWRMVMEERSVMEAILRNGSPITVMMVFLLVVIGAPLGEEVFFRGALLGRLTEAVGPAWALILTSLVFAALHLYVIQFLPVMIAGIYLGMIVLRTRDLTKAVIAHALANCLTFWAMLTLL